MAFIKFTFSNQNHKIYPSSWIKIKEALITHTIDVLFRRDFIVNNQLMNCLLSLETWETLFIKESDALQAELVDY